MDRPERIYVMVSSDFDSTGYMHPKAIIWNDGRIFRIEQVKDFRPAAALGADTGGDCYTVVINGTEKHLFLNGSTRGSPAGSDGGSWRVRRWSDRHLPEFSVPPSENRINRLGKLRSGSEIKRIVRSCPITF